MTSYSSWHDVPEHLFTRTQLEEMDMPRIPAGDPVATVTAPGARRNKETFRLFDVAQTAPSPATARQLRAARARHGFDAYRCADCAAVSERPLGFGVGEDRGRRLCWACHRISALRHSQRLAAADRASAAAWAASLVADPAVLTVLTTPVPPPPAPSGRVGKLVAVTVQAADMNLSTVADLTVDMTGPRSKPLPNGAPPAEAAWPALRRAFDGRRLLTWDRTGLDLIRPALDGAEVIGPGTLAWNAEAWRGLINADQPSKRRPARHPGRADRMALLLHRIAADVPADSREAEAEADA